MRGAADGWMVHEGGDGNPWLFRFNGVAWARRLPLPLGLNIVDLWADDEGQAWLALRRGGKDGDPADILARTDGQAYTALAVPKSFAIQTIRGSGAKDIWFLGDNRKVYQFDGKQLRQGAAPFPVADAWGSPDGDVWFAGGSEAVDDKPRKPMLAHLSAAGVKK
jgi:hypothetical protein